MIPSDHFVKFYNEVFKYLDKRNALPAYYEAISRHQETHCLKMFKEWGIKGIYEYYLTIKKEENCDMDVELIDHGVKLMMHKCPSLSKVLDNDAEPSLKYCDHCPGWAVPIYRKAGFYQFLDMMGADQPKCLEIIFDDLKAASDFYWDYIKTPHIGPVSTSFEPIK